MERRSAYTFRLLGEALISALLGAGLTLIIASAVMFDVDAVQIYIFALAGAGLLAALTYSRASGWITFAALVAAFLIAMAFGYEPLERARALATRLRAPNGIRACASEISVFLMLLILAIAFIVCHQRTGVYAMSLIVLTILGALWYFGAKTASIHLFPVLAALSAMYARASSERATHISPLFTYCAVAALIACLIVPETGVKHKPLEEFGNRALKTMIKLLSIDDDDLESRTSFSISSSGWAGRKDVFGGSANPSNEQVMRVETDDEVYLRGSIRYVYDTRAWVDEDNESKAGKVKRYMLSGIEGLIYKSEYAHTFGLNTSALKSGFVSDEIRVEILTDSRYWSIYAPDRTSKVTLVSDANAYFNNVGELFAGKRLKAGDEYTLEYYKPKDYTDGALREITARLEGDEDKAYTSVLMMNRNLPSGIDPNLRALTASIVQNAQTPYDQAAAIRDWLKTNLSYTLDGGYPPEGRDFVSYFVLDAKQGYCMYFASAMAVMARAAGLPARYVEGYLAKPDESGECVLTGEDAHAWAEVYFKGYGWVTFDATAPDDGERDDNQSNDDNQGDTAPDDALSATPPPIDAPPPTPTPEPTSGDDWSNAPTPTPDIHSAPEQNPTPTPEPDYTAPDVDYDEQTRLDEDENKGMRGLIAALVIIVLIIAIIFAFVYARIVRTRPEYMAKHANSDEDKLMCWYRAMLCALAARGIVYENGLTPASLAERARDMGACDDKFIAFSDIVASARYSCRAPSVSAYALAARAYEGIYKRLKPRAIWRWLLARVISGVGSLNQVP